MDRVWYHHYDPRVPHSLEYPEECLPVALEHNALTLPGVTATEFFGARLTYAALRNQILRFANP